MALGGLTVFQVMLWRDLGSDWIPEFWVPVPGKGNYRLDLAHPRSLTTIEVDDRSHRFRVNKDTSRDQLLVESGWTVLRWRTWETEAGYASLVEKARSLSTISRSSAIHPSWLGIVAQLPITASPTCVI
jgi:very-short-patch-repair endonuclease